MKMIRHEDLENKYRAMVLRCTNPNSSTHKLYGAVGITVCKEWLDSRDTFIEWSLANGYEKGLELDKDMLSDKLGISPSTYSPQTCQYITHAENCNYTSRSVYITYKDKTQTIMDWSKELGIEYKTLQYRLELGWSDEKAISTPVGAIKPGAKYIVQINNDGEVVGTYESAREAGRVLGIHFGGISNVLRGRAKSAGGFTWDYQ